MFDISNQIKTSLRYYLSLIRINKQKKSQKITTVGGDVEKLFHLHTDGEPVKRNSHCEKLDGGFSEMIHRITGRSGNSTSTILNFDSFKERKAGSLRDTCTPAFMAVLVTLAKKKKRVQWKISIHGWADKHDAVYAHDGTLFGLKKEINFDTCHDTDESLIQCAK